jgi:hypothetical protein
MSVTARTMEELVTRVPAASTLTQLEVPIGWEPCDWSRVRSERRGNLLFDNRDGYTHICAVGTVLPTALDGLRALVEGVACVAQDPSARRRLRIWFVGTSNQRRVDAPAIVRPFADAAGVSDVVFEHPPRLAYFDALRVLRDAHAVLVLGSGEPHYTPSRVFPALASRRPVIARLHRESPASSTLSAAARTRQIEVISWSPDEGAQADGFASALKNVLNAREASDASSDELLAPFTGRALAARVATLLDRVSTL